MPRNLKIDEELFETPELTEETAAEEIPEIPAAAKGTGRKRKSYQKAAPKEFDLRAAHQAWKEQHGIEDGDMW